MLLRAAAREGRGRLKIFLGAAPGVGKTYEMLSDGAERLRAGVDVVAGIIETHGRAETEALVAPLEVLPRRVIDHAGHQLTELDLDALLARRPAIALIDELAHSNVLGSRHPKRWQDVAELLDAGIDVYSTLNIQHVESLNDVVASFTRVRVRETVPDHVLEDAEIEVVDLPPDELIERLKAGKVYVPAEATRALGHFFSKPNLSALREMALRQVAQRVDRQMLEDLDIHATPGIFAAGERVLVAVSELPGADALVRAAKRLADALRASLTAVYIETPRARTFDQDQQRRIAEVLRLASSLGATIATVPATSVIEGLRTQVEAMRATQLVIGKSRRPWWFELRHGSVVESMLKLSEGLAVHVIPAAPGQPVKAGASAKASAPKPLGYGVALGAVVATTLLARLVLPVIGAGAIDLIYLLPAIITAGRFGLGPGLASGALAALAYNFFFLPPLYTFTITSPQSVLTVVALMVIAAATSELAGRLRNRATLGTRSAQESAAVAAFGQALARATDWQDTAEVVCREVGSLLAVRVAVLVQRDGGLEVVACEPPEAVMGPLDRAAADWALSRGERTGSGTATLNSADWQFHPLATALGTLALVAVANDLGREPIGVEREVLLSTLLGQAALAHERLRLEDDVRELSVLRERDRLRGALLASVSHDLRTPLTAVTSAIEAIGDQCPDAAGLPAARAEAQRLRRFLDNLLGLVRIDVGALAPAMEPVDLLDAVSLAVHDLRELLRSHRLRTDLPPNLPLVDGDPQLLHHVLINLLANAAQHGRPDGAIIVSGRRTATAVELAVRDDGPGFSGSQADRLFQTFARGEGSDRTGGSGLGLAIVKGFADAMRVDVRVQSQEDDGTTFTLVFPPSVTSEVG